MDTEEIRLIKQTQAGSEAAFEKIFQKYGSALFGICLRYSSSKDEANDMLQEAMIKVSQRIKAFHFYRNIYAFSVTEAFIQHTVKSTVNAEVYEVDGNEFDIQISQFIGVSNFSTDGSILTGLKIGLKPGFHLNGEASCRRNFPYDFNNEYYQSYPKQISFGLGLVKKWK